MKPMPYTPYEPCDCHICDDIEGNLLVNIDPHLSLGPKAITQILDGKRLTEAELSAEYWRALYNRYSAAFMDCDDGIQSPDDEHRQHWHEISTWRRFAEHPHAFGGPDGSTQ